MSCYDSFFEKFSKSSKEQKLSNIEQQEVEVYHQLANRMFRIASEARSNLVQAKKCFIELLPLADRLFSEAELSHYSFCSILELLTDLVDNSNIEISNGEYSISAKINEISVFIEQIIDFENELGFMKATSVNFLEDVSILECSLKSDIQKYNWQQRSNIFNSSMNCTNEAVEYSIKYSRTVFETVSRAREIADGLFKGILLAKSLIVNTCNLLRSDDLIADVTFDKIGDLLRAVKHNKSNVLRSKLDVSVHSVLLAFSADSLWKEYETTLQEFTESTSIIEEMMEIVLFERNYDQRDVEDEAAILFLSGNLAQLTTTTNVNVSL